MIKTIEIENKAKEFGIHPANVQRDYLFGWILSGMYNKSKLGDTLILKGGNALRKVYLPNTRFSDDLDFTTKGAINSEDLLSELNSICEYISARTQVKFDITRNRIAGEDTIKGDKKVYKVRLYFENFHGEPSTLTLSIRLDVTEFDKIYLEPVKKNILHPYSDAEACMTKIRCIKLEEAMADKLKCLLQRRSSFDVFDLANTLFVKNDLEIDNKLVTSTFLKKTIFEPNPTVAKNLLLGIPYQFFKSYWEKHIVCPVTSKLDFQFAVTSIKEGLVELFRDFTYSHNDELAYYPSELRNLILEAGFEHKLLELTYDGISRKVEPYSLIFKRRQDGVAQEYFYVWDQTGGRSGETGIKQLFNWKISNMKLLNETFTPRYTVEVKKAGEPGDGTYFSSSFDTGRSRTVYPYVVKCNYCDKTFRRKVANTKLNNHKNSYGTKCSGKRGYLI